MFSVRPQKTIPQALVASALIIMLCSICLMIEILSIAPQYATFGARTYLDVMNITFISFILSNFIITGKWRY